jgi:hypothetical protein
MLYIGLHCPLEVNNGNNWFSLKMEGWAKWLGSVISASWEAEIGRISGLRQALAKS